MVKEKEVQKAMLEIGQRGRKRREELGITVAEMSSKLSVSYQAIQWLEKHGTLNLRSVMRWADALEMSPADLMFGADARSERLTEATELLSAAAELLDGRQGKRKKLVEEILAFLA